MKELNLIMSSIMDPIYIGAFCFLAAALIYAGISFRKDMNMHKKSMDEARKSFGNETPGH